MRSVAHGGRFLAGAILTFGLATGVGAVQEESRYRDAAPSGVPEGFEPVDISEEMHNVEVRRQREMERDVERGMRARYDTPERRIRARYGGATWNMYDPFH